MRRFDAARRVPVIRRVFVSCVLAIAAGGACAQPATESSGKADKAAVCDGCHGTGERAPQPGMPVLAGQQRDFLVLQMFYMREGLRVVPEMAGLLNGWSDRDLTDIATSYARQTPPRAATTRDPGLRSAGAKLSQAMGCGSCHLKDYSGQKHVPRISNQREDYLASTLKAYRDNKRSGTDTSMNAVMYQATDADIAALAHYLAHQ